MARKDLRMEQYLSRSQTPISGIPKTNLSFNMPFYHSISIFFLLLTFPILFELTTAAKCHVDDENGLLAFKSGITADPTGLLSSWKPGTDCCTWSGITCQSDNRVTRLSVYDELEKPNSFLSGTISPSLSKLRFLAEISFVNLLNISGTFPDLLFHLPNLEHIVIENSKLSGPLPGNIGVLTRLRLLSLGRNRFSGGIPASISKLTHLTYLRLSDNLLTGSIPDGIRQLKNLTALQLDGNQLSGLIPDFFNSFPNLDTITLSHNKFTGQIPASISALPPTTLKYLTLGHNSLTGQIPSFLGKFQTLDTLDLSSNRFTGSVPKSFGNLTKLMDLDLSHNFLVDPFPVINTNRIESLDLSYNSFHLGEIPKWVISSSTIYSLKLAKCGIKIKLDDWKPEKTYFDGYIDLSDNEILGSPIGLLNYTVNLVSFKASNNQLKFDLEMLKIAKALKELDLGRNQVFGKVPVAVIGLNKLNLSYNKLCGSIPPNKFPVETFVGNGCLCGAPLTPCCPRCH